MDLTPLSDMICEWLQSVPRDMERTAFLKDATGLIALCHKNPQTLRIQGSTVANKTVQACCDIRRFLQEQVIKPLQHNLPGIDTITSPYAGGVSRPSNNELPRTHQASAGGDCYFGIASINPGRTGLSALGTDALLHWRLWAINFELLEKGVRFCAVPGARFPPGSCLPEGFRYVWRGVQSDRWDTVGVFIDIEYEQLFTELQGVGNDRCRLFRLDASNELMILGALCGPPGGDMDLWIKVTADYAALKRRYPSAQIIMSGDANIHLSYILRHEHPCACLHCNQSPCDREIEALLTAHGIAAHNPSRSTHVSGTAIN